MDPCCMQQRRSKTPSLLSHATPSLNPSITNSCSSPFLLYYEQPHFRYSLVGYLLVGELFSSGGDYYGEEKESKSQSPITIVWGSKVI